MQNNTVHSYMDTWSIASSNGENIPAYFIGGRPSEAISERCCRRHSIDRADDDNICSAIVRVKNAATLGFREQDFDEDIVHPNRQGERSGVTIAALSFGSPFPPNLS